MYWILEIVKRIPESSHSGGITNTLVPFDALPEVLLELLELLELVEYAIALLKL
jgi:hypothetical protein